MQKKRPYRFVSEDDVQKKRTMVQIVFAVITNAYWAGFAKGAIYTGFTKEVCLPGLNCYSCPGALGACPIGAMQAVSTRKGMTVPFYALGFIMAYGALFGRFICGWLCPFGLVQDILHKIPIPKKVTKVFRGDRFLRYFKYVVLAFLVLLLPMYFDQGAGTGSPWFCKFLCPSGTLFAAWPLTAVNKGLAAGIGYFYYWKTAILVTLLLLSMIVYRPFCKYLCPLGAMYGLLNRVSLYGYTVESKLCTACGACALACPMQVEPHKTPNSCECIRCGRCLTACPTGALHKKSPAGALHKKNPAGALQKKNPFQKKENKVYCE